MNSELVGRSGDTNSIRFNPATEKLISRIKDVCETRKIKVGNEFCNHNGEVTTTSIILSPLERIASLPIASQEKEDLLFDYVINQFQACHPSGKKLNAFDARQLAKSIIFNRD